MFESPHAVPGKRRPCWLGWLSGLVVVLAVAPGCTRKFFRQRADNDVTGVLTQKNVFSAWKIENWWVYPDPRARYADLSNPDRPPYPPDDYAAYRLSPNPQQPGKKAGVGRVEGDGWLKHLSAWDCDNRAQVVPQPPQSNEPVPTLPAGIEPLPMPKAASTSIVPDVPSLLLPPFKYEPSRPQPAGASANPASAGLPAVQNKPVDASRLPPPQIEMIVTPAAPVRPAGPDEKLSSQLASAGIVPASATAEAPGPVITAKAEGPPRNLPDILPPVPPVAPAQPASVAPQPLPPAISPPAPLGPPTPVDPKAAEPKSDPQPSVEEGPVKAATKSDDYMKALDTKEKNGFRLKMDQAVLLGVFNSREHQDQREALYNAALPVTLQRFSFAAQAFATETAVRRSLGPQVAGGPLEQWQLTGTTGFGKLFPTGGSVLAQMANQFVINLGSSTPYVSVSNFSLTLAQPFLQGGGFAVALEPLTDAERTLLYAIRSFARYRKLFYVAITAGGNYTNNPYGLAGLSVNLGRGVGANLTSPSAGYIPTLLRDAVNAQTKKNIASLTQLLKLYQAFREGGQQSDLQVAQVEQQLIGVQSNLLGPGGPVGIGGGATSGGTGSATSGGLRGWLDNLDNFKLQLGLPLTVPLELDDAPLRPISQQLSRFEAVYKDLSTVETEARKYDPAEPVERFRQTWRNLLTESRLAKGTKFAGEILARWGLWEGLTDDAINRRMAVLRGEKQKLLDRKTDRQTNGLPDPADETTRLITVDADIDLGQFERAVRRYVAQPWAKEKGSSRAMEQAAAFRDVFNNFYQVILEARNDRLARIREQWPKLPPLMVNGNDLLKTSLDEAYTAGIQTALSNRLDLLNTRALAVDQWRQIKVTANALLGVLNVQYNLNSSTPPYNANATDFSTGRTSQTLTINAALPLVRRAERNAYRSALIAYQSARRLVIAFEDNISNDVRGDIRELRVIAEQYYMQQRLVELGYTLVDNAQEILIAPPAPDAKTDPGSAAALTLQVLQAQSTLLTAQTNLYVIWVNYMVSRMQFFLDMELMTLDPRGLWIDDFSPHDYPNARTPGAPERPPAGERLPAPRPAAP